MVDLGKTLILVGLGLLAGAVGWWYLFFQQILGDKVKSASACFYYTTDACSFGDVLAMVGGVPTYSPLAFWVSVIAVGSGVILVAAAHRSQ